MSAALPEDLMMEYDLLHLAEHDENHSAAAFPASPSSFFMTETEQAAQTASANHLADEDAMINDLLMQGEHFLSEMDMELSQKQLESTVEWAEKCDLLASPCSMYSPSDDTMSGQGGLDSVADCPYAYMMNQFLTSEELLPGQDVVPMPATPSSIQQHESVDLTTEDDADDDDLVEEASAAEESKRFEQPEEEAAPHKNDFDLLQKEAKYLEAQYDYLVSRAKSQKPQRAGVKTKRRGRETAASTAKSQDNTVLSELVSQQQVYLQNLKAMLSFAPVSDVRMALATPIESYIHLGRDFDDRRRTIMSLRDEKLDMTFRYIEGKAEGLNVEQPYQYSDMFEKFGKNYCVNFAITKYDGVEVMDVAKAIHDQIAGKDEAMINAMGCMTLRESYDQIKCNFMHQRVVSSMKWNDEALDNMPDIESNSIMYNRYKDNVCVMAIDYIDKDDLHPYLHNDRIRKDVTSGVVLSEHVDANGKKSVIMKRFLMAKFHMYPHHASKEQNEKFFTKLPLFHEKMSSLVADKMNMAEGEKFGHMHPASLPIDSCCAGC